MKAVPPAERRRATDHPFRHLWRKLVVQMADSRLALGAIVASMFAILGVLAYGIVAGQQEAERSRAAQRKLLNVNQEILEVNQDIIEQLADLEVARSEATAAGHAALAENLRCVALAFLEPENGGPRDFIEGCFRPTETPPKLPSRPGG